jgi:putative oxidoreductase
MSLVETGTRAYTKFVDAASWLRSPLLLAIRVFWGWGFFVAGKGKFGDLDKVAGFFGNLGIPAPKLNAILAASTETVGGLLLLLGLGARLISLPLAFTMIVAFLTADIDAVKAAVSNPDGVTSAAPFLFLYAALIVLAFGPGAISLDAIIAKRLGGARPEPPPADRPAA